MAGNTCQPAILHKIHRVWFDTFLICVRKQQCLPPSSRGNAPIHIEKALQQIGRELFLWQLLLKAYGIFALFIFPIVWYFTVSISFIKRNRISVNNTRFKAEGFITHIMCLMFEIGKDLTADSQTFFFCIHSFHFSCFIDRKAPQPTGLPHWFLAITKAAFSLQTSFASKELLLLSPVIFWRHSESSLKRKIASAENGVLWRYFVNSKYQLLSY